MNIHFWLLSWHGESQFLFYFNKSNKCNKKQDYHKPKTSNTFNHCDNGYTPMYLRAFASLVLVETRTC